MRNILLTSATLAAFLAAAPVLAQESPTPPPNAPAAESDADTNITGSTAVDTGVAVGGTAGAVTGAIVGGPVGAVIGGFAGAMLGTAAAVPQPAVDYVVAHPVEPVVIEGGVSAGMVVPEAVTLTPIPDHPEYAYVYVDGRPVLVRMESREVVYSPGYVVAPQTVSYVEANPPRPGRHRRRHRRRHGRAGQRPAGRYPERSVLRLCLHRHGPGSRQHRLAHRGLGQRRLTRANHLRRGPPRESRGGHMPSLPLFIHSKIGM